MFPRFTIPRILTKAEERRLSDGKRYNHQRRLSKSVLSESRARLLRASLEKCNSFEHLHDEVESAIGSVSGIGELTTYDTALRIGAKLGLSPKRVYLHRGTRSGARALGLNWRLPYLDRADLPEALQELPPHEVEDLLCIYKKYLTPTLR